MPKPTASGRSVTLRVRSTRVRRGPIDCLLLAGDTRSGDQIHEPARILCHQLQPPLRAGRRGEKHGVEALCARIAPTYGSASSTLRSVSRQPSIPDAAASAASSRKPYRITGFRYVNSSSGISDCRRISRRDIQHLAHRRSGAKRAVGGSLNHGTIGDRVGEGNAELDQVGSATFQRVNQPGRRDQTKDRRLSDTRSGPAGASARSRSNKLCDPGHHVTSISLNVFAVDVGIFIAAAGEIHDEDLTLGVRSAADGFSDRVRRFECRDDPFGSREQLRRFDRLGVGSGAILRPAPVVQPCVLGPDRRVIESSGNGVGQRRPARPRPARDN